MDYFKYKYKELYCEDLKVSTLADKFSTPLYIYSLKTIVRHFRVTSEAFGDIPHLICYAAKANSNLAILKTAALCGAGCDVVSIGELKSALKAGIERRKIVFSGVGKTDDEIATAIKANILFICVESLQELETISKISSSIRKNVNIAVRVNPEIDPKTHPYIATGLKKTKFGLSEKETLIAYFLTQKMKYVHPVGISMHIGSQIEYVGPYSEATKKIIDIYRILAENGINLKYIDIGGGWAAHFGKHAQRLPHPENYVRATKRFFKNLPVTVLVEPGRSIVGNAGILVTRVIMSKKTHNKTYCVVDAGMNDFIRPVLYHGLHRIEPVIRQSRKIIKQDVVGPICENSDYFAKNLQLPLMHKGDLLAVFTAGAYGSVMSSNYNSRLRSAEVAVAGDKTILIKKRESYGDLERGQNSAGISISLVKSLET